MSSYEQYRHAILVRLTDRLPAELLNDVMLAIDQVSSDYDISHVCTDLITVEAVPEIVKAFIAALAVQNCKKSTLKDYRNILTSFFQIVRKSFTNVTTNDIRCYLFNQQTQNEWVPETTEHHRIVINSFYNWLVENEYIGRNPAKPIKPARLPKKKLKPLQQIELEKFRNACKTLRERCLVDFFFATGCRVSEAAAVLLSDINWQEQSVLIRHGKGDKERYVYFNAEAELSMKSYLGQRDGNDEHLFVSTRAPYLGLSRESLEKDIRNIRERIPDELSIKVTPHTFRRTMGTTAVKRGCPIEQVKEMLGHESLNTTMQYVTVTQDEVKQSHKKYLAG
jgi:site-specific recombinase XerD